MELMASQLLANRGEVAFGHLQREDVVRDVPVRLGIKVMRQPRAAAIGQTADYGGLTFGKRLDLSVALHLAFQAVCHHGSMRGLDQGLVDRLLLPVVAVAELFDGMPARKNIVGEVVVQVDESGRNDAMGIDNSCICRQLSPWPRRLRFCFAE